MNVYKRKVKKLIHRILKFSDITTSISYVHRFCGSEIQSGHIPPGWVPKCPGLQPFEKAELRTEISWKLGHSLLFWQLMLTIVQDLSVVSLGSLNFLTVSGWVPGVSISRKRNGQTEACPTTGLASQVTKYHFSIVYWLEQS